jgi:hypothetical protein
VVKDRALLAPDVGDEVIESYWYWLHASTIG